MKLQRVIWLSALLAWSAIAQLSTDANREQAISEQDRESIELRLDEIAAAIIELRNQRSRQNEQLDRLFTELAELEQQLQETRRLLGDNRAELDVISNELTGLEQQEQVSQAALDGQQQQLNDQLAAAYRLGRQSRLKLLLNLESADELTRMLAYHERFSEQRAVLIGGIQQQLQTLAELRTGIEQRRSRIEALNAEYETDLQSLAVQQRQRRLLAGDIRAELGSLETEIAELQLNQQELEELLANLQDLFADIPDEVEQQPFGELRGQLAWPVATGRPRLSARFGQTRAAGVDWSGIFIDVPEGEPVSAVAHGRVAFADWLRGFGWMIIIDHNDGYMSLYGNNSQLMQEVGSWVQAGEQLAVSGSGFGADLRNGVYFELRRDGRAYNPEPWLVKP